MQSRGNEALGSSIAYERLYMTRVEVLDPQGRSVLASETVPHFVWGTLPGGRALTYTVSEHGDAFVSVLRLRLHGR
jgi:hypothetical protein